jgi:hypothetical protein
MADNFFVNEPFTVSQNVELYAQTQITNDTVYEYILSININAAEWSSMNQLFGARTFVQNSATQNTAGENLTDINLSADLSALNTLLYSTDAVAISSTMTDVSGNVAYNTLTSGQKLLGLRFLEVVATKVFGHARARAAIVNDTEFYAPLATADSIVNQIATGINSALTNKASDVFNIYVAYDRVQDNNQNDVDGPVDFNFDNTNWEFPIYFESTLQDIGNDANMDELNNGPDVGGNQLINGSMNVPILLRFHA